MAKGENIYKRKDGRWEGRYKKGYDQNKKIRYGYCYGHSYREVKEKLCIAKADYTLHASSKSSVPAKKNFGMYCMQWMKMHESRLKKSTLVKYNFMLEKHIKPVLGSYPVNELTSDKIAEFSEELSKKKQLSEKTVRDVLIFVHEITVYIQQDTGTLFPIAISYPRLEHKELRILSVEEQQCLIQYLLQDTDVYKFSVLLALFTGLRIGEVCALQWKHISSESGLLSVKQTVQRIKNLDSSSENRTILLLSTPKTASSVRTIPIMEGLLTLTETFRPENPDAFILTGSDHLADPRKLQRRLKKYTAVLGLQNVHFHTLRHTFATRCIESGCDTKTLSDILGHSDISTTMNRYVHPSMDFKRQNIIRLEQSGFFPSSCASSEMSSASGISR